MVQMASGLQCILGDPRPSLTAIIRVGEGSGARAVAEVAGRGQAGVPAVAAAVSAVAAAVGRGLRPAGRRGLRPAVQHLLRCHDQAELAVAAKVLEREYTRIMI